MIFCSAHGVSRILAKLLFGFGFNGETEASSLLVTYD